MNTASPIVCPKCGYARTAAETAPDWQCPSCGIAYNKFQAKPENKPQATKPAHTGAVTDNRKAGKPFQQGKTTGAAGVVYLGLLGTGIFVPYEGIWLWVLPPMIAASFVFWLDSYRTKSQVLNVPTSRVASAVQGYVELHGTVEYVPGCTLTAPLTNAPCVWYQYGVVEGSGKRARTVESGNFGTPFLLRDDTGDCLVDPNEAYVLCDMHDEWVKGNRTYTEWSIRIGDPIYAIGRFSSDALHADGELGKETMVRLRAWLRDPKAFFGRFDANRDGKIAAAELAAAREAAQREAAQYYTAQGGMHTLTAPEDRRPFVLANAAHDQVASHFSALTWVHLGIFFITLGFLAWNWL